MCVRVPQGVNLSNIVKRVPGASPESDPEAVKLSRTLAEQMAELDDEATEEIMFGGGMMRLTFLAAAAEPAAAIGATAAALKKEVQRDEQATTLAGATNAIDTLTSASLALLRVEDTAPLVSVLEARVESPRTQSRSRLVSGRGGGRSGNWQQRSASAPASPQLCR